MTCAPKRHRGFGIMGAFFVVVVLAGLGAYMVMMSWVEHATTTQSLVASRVYYAAKAGLDWGVHRAIAAGGSCTASTTFTIAGDISVTVTCNSGTSSGVFYLTSQASYGSYGSAFYSQRRLEASVANF